MIQLAWAALTLWPLVTLVLYRKYSMPVALCASVIGGYLLLPTREGLDLPVLPRLDKYTIPALSAFAVSLIMLSDKRAHSEVSPGWLPRSFLVRALLVLVVIGAFGTASTNRDFLVYGPRFIPSMRIYDSLSLLLQVLMLLIPLFLGRRILASAQGQKVLLTSIVGWALFYSLLALWEVRMSPQLNVHIYGFFPHSFMQHMRAGGFRPLVFLHHGLQLGIFLTLATLGAVALFRNPQETKRIRWALAALWLFATLVLSKTLGALGITLALLPVALFLTSRTQLLIATCIAAAVITYPVLRSASVIPIEQISNFAAQIDVQRADSLNTRLVNEDVLLARAQERPIFGWGGYGRNRIFDEFGQNISITDGTWIIELGVGGWFRYIAIFGLLCCPIIGLFISKRERIDPVCAALALMLSAKLLDLIPNSGLSPVMWLIAGSLWGRLEARLPDLRNKGSEVISTDEHPKLGYTRYAQERPKKSMASARQHEKAAVRIDQDALLLSSRSMPLRRSLKSGPKETNQTRSHLNDQKK